MSPSPTPSLTRHGWIVAVPALGCGGGAGPGANEAITGDWALVSPVTTESRTDEVTPYYNPYCPPSYDVIYEGTLTRFDLRVNEEYLARANLDEFRTVENTCDETGNSERTLEFYVSGPVTRDEEFSNRYRIELRSDARNFAMDCEMSNRQLTCQIEDPPVEVQLARP
jgi:hypothetical protein